MQTTVLCECNSWCKLSIEIDAYKALDLYRKGYLVISKKCAYGPSSMDTVIEENDDYIVVKEKSNGPCHGA